MPVAPRQSAGQSAQKFSDSKQIFAFSMSFSEDNIFSSENSCVDGGFDVR
jgi:hypothetical protein